MLPSTTRSAESKLQSQGANPGNFDFQRRIGVSRTIAQGVTIIALLWAGLGIYLDAPICTGISVGVAAACTGGLLLHFRGRHTAARCLWLGVGSTGVFFRRQPHSFRRQLRLDPGRGGGPTFSSFFLAGRAYFGAGLRQLSCAPVVHRMDRRFSSLWHPRGEP